MDGILKCLCGAGPVIEEKPIHGNCAIDTVFKYRCPNCKEKELPWLGQWNHCGALQEWNHIAQKRSYHKRTLEYNEHGVCISTPDKIFEWRDKKKTYYKVTVNFYFDNLKVYYCFDFNYKNNGHGYGLFIRDRCFPSLELAKKDAMKEILRSDNNLEKIIERLFY